MTTTLSASSPATDAPDLLLRAEHLTLRRGQYDVIHDLSFELARQQSLAILGPNGSGKTTLLRLLLGLLPPTHGRVCYFNHGHPAARLNMGYLPQQSRLDPRFPISVAQVVASGLLSRNSLFNHRLTPAQQQTLHKLMAEVGIDSLANRPIGQISGGQLQRALLARALAPNPELLLLDEPDAYLDAEARTLLRSLLERQAQQRALIVVTHNPHTLLPPGTRILRL